MGIDATDAMAGSLALELHTLLRELDPARWHRDRVPSLRARLHDIEERLKSLIEGSIPSRADLRNRLSDVAAALESVRLSDGSGRAAWMRLRSRLSPAYAELAIQLRGASVQVPVLRPTNYRRNLFHVMSASLALAMGSYWPEHMLKIIGPVFVWAWSMEALRPFFPRLNNRLMRWFGPVAHQEEAQQINSATWFATALTILAVYGDTAVGIVGVAVMGFGDPIAGFVGRRFGRHRLVFGRTLQGSLAFATSGGLVAFVCLTLMLELSAQAAWPLAVAGGIGGAVSELGCGRRLDDNFVTPLVATAAAAAVRALM